jgi:thioesterase domain-containing protein
MRQARLEAMFHYVPQPYTGKVSLFRTSEPIPDIAHAEVAEVTDIHERATRGDPTYGWSSIVTEPIDVRPVPGHHEAMIYEPYVDELAQELRRCLDEIEQELAGAAAPATVRRPS